MRQTGLVVAVVLLSVSCSSGNGGPKEHDGSEVGDVDFDGDHLATEVLEPADLGSETFDDSGGSELQPNCESVLFAVDSVVIDGEGEEHVVSPEQTSLEFSFDWWLANGPDCPTCTWEVFVIVEGEGLDGGCIAAPVAPICPDSIKESFAGSVNLPEAFGTYKLVAGIRVKSDCSEGSEEAAQTAVLGSFKLLSSAALNTPPAVTDLVLTTGENGQHMLDFALLDVDSDICAVEVAFQEGGTQWQAATIGGSTPFAGLQSSVDGTAHSLHWSSLPDLGKYNSKDVIVRVTPVDEYATGTPSQVGPVDIDNGQFQLADETVERLPEFTGDSRYVDGADIDGDGDMDLAVAVAFAANLLLKNDGKGVFSAVDLPGGKGETQSLVFVDLNEDGRADLFFGNVNEPVRVLINDGSGQFSDETESWLGGDFSYQIERVLPGDLDGDGDQDLILLCSGSQTERMLRNDGDKFTDVTAAVLPADTFMVASGSLGSIDNEGPPDLVFNNFISSQTLTLWVNQDDGTFIDESFRILDPVESMGFDAVLADFNGDGYDDIFEGTMMNLQRVLINDGFGKFMAMAGAIPSGLGPAADGVMMVSDVEAGDVDLNGSTDIFLSGSGTTPGYNDEVLLLGAGTGAFVTYDSLPLPEEGGDSRHARFIDIDGDLDLDIFVVNAFSQSRLILNK
jgi:hypothetical protein